MVYFTGYMSRNFSAPDDVHTPAFVDLDSRDVAENAGKLKSAGVTYPFGE